MLKTRVASRSDIKPRQIMIATGLCLGMAFSSGAAADWYFGANAGPMLIDTAGVDDPTNAGVLVGHEWGVVIGDVGVQGEFTTTLNDGSYAGHDVSIDTQAVYGALRTAGPVYLIAKAGFLREEVKVGSTSDTDSGSSAGLGVGFSLGVVQIEIEYTQVEQDISYLSVGVRF